MHGSQRAATPKLKRNLAFAFVYSALGVPLGAGLLYPFAGRQLSPMMAASGLHLVSIVALAGGFVAFLCVQYGLLITTHRMLEFHMFDALRTIIAINFLPLMSFVAIVSTFAWRRTGHHLPGALISAAFVAWYVVVGQATQAV
jgi:hypothetical protein